VHLARFLHAEDRVHEVPPSALFPAPKVRPLPYIYTPGEVAQIVEAAGRLRQTYPLRREVYATLLGLIAATGLRISEVLDLRFGDQSSASVASSSPICGSTPARIAPLLGLPNRKRRRWSMTGSSCRRCGLT